MRAVLVHYNTHNRDEVINGIYNGVAEYKAPNGDLIAIYKAKTRLTKGHIKARNIISYFPLMVSGDTYAERKEDVRTKAIIWNYAASIGIWSYGELAEIQGFFEENGKRYGLTKEFKENGII